MHGPLAGGQQGFQASCLCHVSIIRPADGPVAPLATQPPCGLEREKRCGSVQHAQRIPDLHIFAPVQGLASWQPQHLGHKLLYCLEEAYSINCSTFRSNTQWREYLSLPTRCNSLERTTRLTLIYTTRHGTHPTCRHTRSLAGHTSWRLRWSGRISFSILSIMDLALLAPDGVANSTKP